MRIVFLCNSFWPNVGGAELVCKDIVDTLSEKHDVTVITQPASNRSNSQYNIIELKAVTSYSIMKELPKTLKIVDADLYISFGYGKFFSDFTGKFAKDNNKPFIFMPCGDFHTNKTDTKKLFYEKTMGKKAFNFANSIITATNWEKNHWIQKYNIPANKFNVIEYNLPKHFTEYKHSKITPFKSKQYYLYIGRNGPNKKIKELIEGYKLVNSHYDLFIVGNNTDCDELKKLKTPNIHFFGKVTEDYKKHFIKHARAVIYPSNFESFGMCILEANAFNTPVLVSDIPPFKELLSNQEIFFNNNPIEISNMFKKYENKNIPFKKIILPNFKKKLNEVINNVKNRN